MSLDDPLSRTANQGFFDRPTVADGSGTDAGQPFDSLFDFAVHATVLARQGKCGDQAGQTGDVVGWNDEILVGATGFEPVTSAL